MEAVDDLSLQISELLILYERKNPGFIHKDLIPKLLDDLGIVFVPAELLKFQTSFAPSTDANGLIPKSVVEKAVDPLLRRLNEEKLKEWAAAVRCRALEN